MIQFAYFLKQETKIQPPYDLRRHVSESILCKEIKTFEHSKFESFSTILYHSKFYRQLVDQTKPNQTLADHLAYLFLYERNIKKKKGLKFMK